MVARPRREPPLSLQERRERLAFEHATRAAVDGIAASRRPPAAAGAPRRSAFESAGAAIACVICIGLVLEREPVRRIRTERQKIRLLADAREFGQPAISIGISPANACRSSSAGWTVRDRLATTRIVSCVVAAEEREHLAVRHRE